MAGRRPTPTALKLVTGNPGKRALNKKEPKPRVKAPTCPAHLDPVSKAVWKKLCTLLKGMGVLTEADGFALERLVDCYRDIIECRELIERDGRTYTTIDMNSTRYVTPAELELVMRTARERGGMYVVAALCLRAAYLTVSRPDEMRHITRKAITDQGVEMPVGKRKGGQAQKFKVIEWLDDLRAVIDEALKLQRTTSLYVFGNSEGQPYTTSGWNTNLRRLMEHARKKAEKEGIEFTRFRLKDMRPAAVTDRVDKGDTDITNATGHSSDRMVKQVYDRRKKKTARATE